MKRFFLLLTFLLVGILSGCDSLQSKEGDGETDNSENEGAQSSLFAPDVFYDGSYV